MTPCPALGFSTWLVPPPPPGWACNHVSDPPRRSATTAQRHTAGPSCPGSGRAISEFGTPSSVPSCASPVQSQWLDFTGVDVRVSAPMVFPSGSSCVLCGKGGRSSSQPSLSATLCRISRELALHLRSQGICLRTYLDDWLILANSGSLSLQFPPSGSLGFIPTWKKSDLSTSQRFHFLQT